MVIMIMMITIITYITQIQPLVSSVVPYRSLRTVRVQEDERKIHPAQTREWFVVCRPTIDHRTFWKHMPSPENATAISLFPTILEHDARKTHTTKTRETPYVVSSIPHDEHRHRFSSSPKEKSRKMLRHQPHAPGSYFTRHFIAWIPRVGGSLRLRQQRFICYSLRLGRQNFYRRCSSLHLFVVVACGVLVDGWMDGNVLEEGGKNPL
ncbi:hypothetical protein OUZ56_004954 [Daphnia magna]|uniref:Secreted protein n=1 Tax=Daphnia magna TaxID=35525 RepID=A0ABQ9YRC2_9CRUS|nr:hypothetical protein OUZ56_004954 [Daphnia magna]